MVFSVLRNQNSISFILSDGNTFMMSSNHPQWEEVSALLSSGDMERAYRITLKKNDALASVGWKIEDGVVMDEEGRALPGDLSKRILDMMDEERQLTPLVLFWQSLIKNPSKRSVESLWGFLHHENIPVGEDGRIVGYKAVRSDLMDIFSGTFLNEPGAHFKMDRNRVSDDPRTACHEGFHVGSLDYATSFKGSDGVIVIVAVKPEHVVCVPYDHDCGKMRVCEYTVLGMYSGEALPNTVLEDEDIPNTGPDVPDTAPTYDNDVYTDESGLGCGAFIQMGEPQECVLGNPKYANTSADPVETGPAAPGAASWATMDALGRAELLGYSFKDLRRYCSNHLKVVGVSKMKGTKNDLVEKILLWRR